MYELIGPHWHPIVVHFTVALLSFAALLYVIAFFRKTPTSAGLAADWVFVFGVAALIITAGFGFMAYYTVAHDGPSHAAMTDHRNWALATAVVFLALGLWRLLAKKAGALFVAGMVAATLVLGVTGFKGGHLVFSYGLGVQSLPEAEGPGHHHDHGGGEGHAQEGAEHADGGIDHEEAGAAHDHDEGAAAHDHDEAAETMAAGTTAVAGASSPQAAADAFQQALVDGDEAAATRLLAENVVILEGGGVETSRDQYVSGHMKSDMAFLKAVDADRISRRADVNGDTAWVATETNLRGRYHDQDVAIRSQETLVLRRAETGWIITHVHWSNAPFPAGDEAAAATEEGDGHSDHEH